MHAHVTQARANLIVMTSAFSKGAFFAVHTHMPSQCFSHLSTFIGEKTFLFGC